MKNNLKRKSNTTGRKGYLGKKRRMKKTKKTRKKMTRASRSMTERQAIKDAMTT